MTAASTTRRRPQHRGARAGSPRLSTAIAETTAAHGRVVKIVDGLGEGDARLVAARLAALIRWEALGERRLELELERLRLITETLASGPEGATIHDLLGLLERAACAPWMRSVVSRLRQALASERLVPSTRDLGHRAAIETILAGLEDESRLHLRAWLGERESVLSLHELRREARFLAELERVATELSETDDDALVPYWLARVVRRIVDCGHHPITRAADPNRCSQCGCTTEQVGRTIPSPSPATQREMTRVGLRYLHFRRTYLLPPSERNPPPSLPIGRQRPWKGFTTHVYADWIIDRLVAWLAEGGHDSEHVILLGIPYVGGLNEHQLTHARVASLSPPSLLFPRTRSVPAMATAERAEASLADPGWLAAAAATYLRERHAAPGQLLVARDRARDLPVGANWIRSSVKAASAAALGVELTPAGLSHTMIAHAARRGLFFVAEALGYAPGYATRLATAEPRSRRR